MPRTRLKDRIERDIAMAISKNTAASQSDVHDLLGICDSVNDVCDVIQWADEGNISYTTAVDKLHGIDPTTDHRCQICANSRRPVGYQSPMLHCIIRGTTHEQASCGGFVPCPADEPTPDPIAAMFRITTDGEGEYRVEKRVQDYSLFGKAYWRKLLQHDLEPEWVVLNMGGVNHQFNNLEACRHSMKQAISRARAKQHGWQPVEDGS